MTVSVPCEMADLPGVDTDSRDMRSLMLGKGTNYELLDVSVKPHLTSATGRGASSSTLKMLS